MGSTTAARSRIDTVALRRAREQRLRQVGAQPAPTAYVPRHRADVPVDSAA